MQFLQIFMVVPIYNFIDVNVFMVVQTSDMQFIHLQFT